MNEFVIYSWIACLLISFFLIWIFFSARYLFVKPSIFFILFFHVQLQWISTLNAEYVYNFLQEPWHYFYLVNIFPLMVLMISFLTGRQLAKRIVKESNIAFYNFYNKKHGQKLLLWSLLIIITLVFSWYLSVVPFTATGFYAMIHSLPNQDIIREETFKLLNNPSLIYSYSIMSDALVPIASILISFEIEKKLYSYNFFKVIFYLFLLCFNLLVISIYGSKAPALTMLFGIVWAFYISRGMPFALIRMFLITLVLLIVPSVMSILINNNTLSLSTFISYYADILDRTFCRIMLPGLWYVDYAQKIGNFGIAGIPKLANLIGVTAVDSANIIGKSYLPTALESVSANASFIFVYYSYFGLLILVPCVIITLLLDCLLWIYLTIDKSIRISIIACCSITSINFIQTQFTTVLFTGGLLPIIFIGLAWTIVILSGRKLEQTYA